MSTDKSNRDTVVSGDQPADYFFVNGLMVMTESYHLKRGHCCGNKCRHCPYQHKNVKIDIAKDK